MTHIDSSEISIVVQGAINNEYTKLVLESLRKSFSKSEIILSTWKGSDVSGLDFDILVENQDPGAPVLFPQSKQYHNLNRQIISTINGIKNATKKYVLKTRTDIIFNNCSVLDWFDKFDKRIEYCKILEKKVIICNYYVRFPNILPFHVSDWVFFGLKKDVENIWDIPLEPEPDYTKWFYNHELLPEHKNNGEYSHFRHRYCAEQYIWSEFLKKNGINFTFENMFDVTKENINLTNISFVNNLIILPMKKYGIHFLKFYSEDVKDIYTFTHYEMLYKKYIDTSYTINIIKILTTNKKILKCQKKLKKHIRKFLKPLKKQHIIFEPFSILFYFFKFLILTFMVSITYIKEINNV